MCGEIFFSLGYLRLTQRLAVVIIQVVNLTKIYDELPGGYDIYTYPILVPRSIAYYTQHAKD